MRDAVHLERVETDFLRHRRRWRGAASAIPDLVCARASFRGGAALSSGRAEVAILRARMRLRQASPCTEHLAAGVVTDAAPPRLMSIFPGAPSTIAYYPKLLVA